MVVKWCWQTRRRKHFWRLWGSFRETQPDSCPGVIPIRHYVISTKTYVLAWILLRTLLITAYSNALIYVVFYRRKMESKGQISIPVL